MKEYQYIKEGACPWTFTDTAIIINSQGFLKKQIRIPYDSIYNVWRKKDACDHMDGCYVVGANSDDYCLWIGEHISGSTQDELLRNFRRLYYRCCGDVKESIENFNVMLNAFNSNYNGTNGITVKKGVSGLTKEKEYILMSLNENTLHIMSFPEAMSQIYDWAKTRDVEDEEEYVNHGLYFFDPLEPNSEDPYFKDKKIPVEDIIDYYIKGEIYSKTYTSGGEITGGGSSIKGAVIGGLIAGEAGAIIGSRQAIKQTPLSTHTITVDPRELVIHTSSIDVKTHVELYEILLKLLPEKARDYSQRNERNENETKYNFCPYCGTKVPPGARFCPSCGKQL